MALLSTDEINNIQLYFEEMDISESEKFNRINLCQDLFYVFYYIFAVVVADLKINGIVNVAKTAKDLAKRINDVIKESDYSFILNSIEIEEYSNDISKKLVESTMRNTPVESKQSQNYVPAPEANSQYWDSKDRAIKVAQDITNVIANYSELQIKKEEGYTHKTWVSILDDKTRNSHWLAWGKTVPIDEAFEIGGYKMMCPCDHTAPAQEIANCRCSLHYSKQ